MPDGETDVKPLPVPDIDTAPFWAAAAHGRLSVPTCVLCCKLTFPPKPCCPCCFSPLVNWVELSGEGRVHSFCIMHMRLVPGFQPPYAVGVIELKEQCGLLITAGIVDCPLHEIRTGMWVEAVFDRRTDAIAVPQFKPARGPNGGAS